MKETLKLAGLLMMGAIMGLTIGYLIEEPKAPTKIPEPETEKNYPAPFTRYTTDRGLSIDRIIIGTDTLYGSPHYKTLIHK